MKLKFWEKEPEYLEEGEEKRKKPKETLKSVSEKLLIRRMKKQPDTFGIEVAQRTMGVSKEEGIGELMKQLRELKKFEGEFGGKGGGESWLRQLGSGIAEGFAPVVADIIGNLARARQPGVEPRPQIEQRQQPRLPKPEAKPEEAEAESEESKADEVFIPDLEHLLELEPEQAAAELEELNPNWVQFLGTQSHEDLFALLQKLPRNQENERHIEELLSEKRRSWLKELINECRKLIKTG